MAAHMVERRLVERNVGQVQGIDATRRVVHRPTRGSGGHTPRERRSTPTSKLHVLMMFGHGQELLNAGDSDDEDADPNARSIKAHLHRTGETRDDGLGALRVALTFIVY